MGELPPFQSVLRAFSTGEAIREAEEYYNSLLNTNPTHVIHILFDSISQSPSNRSLQLILLSRIFTSFGPRFAEIPGEAFHRSVIATLMNHLCSPSFSSEERRHLSFLVSRASAVYRDWPELSDLLLRLSYDSNFEIAASGIDCLSLCAENKSQLLPDKIYHNLLTNLISIPNELIIGPSLRLLYAVIHNSEHPALYHPLLDRILPLFRTFLDSPIICQLMSNFCTFLENSNSMTAILGPSLIRPMMELLNNPQLDEGLRTCSSYLIEFLISRTPELFIPDDLALELFDLCVRLFSELPIARELLQRASKTFGGTVEFAVHCADVFSAFEGQQASAFEIFGICLPDCISHLAFGFREWVMPSLLVGGVHSNEAIRGSAFQMLSRGLKSLPPANFHNAPLLEIAHLILHALSCETDSIALSAELSALSKFCRHCFVPAAHPVVEIVNACDHYCPTDNKLAIVACYRDLADAGCALSERSISFLIAVLQGPPQGRVFFKVLGSIGTFLTVFPPSIIGAVESFLIQYLENCEFNELCPNELRALHGALVIVQEHNPDVGFLLFGRFLEHSLARIAIPLPICEIDISDPILSDSETLVENGIAVQARGCDLRDRKLLLFNLLIAIRICPAAAAAHGIALAEAVRGLLVGHLWDSLVPNALKVVRAVAPVLPGLADFLIGPLINLIDIRSNDRARILRTLAAVIAELRAPNVPAVFDFVRDQILRCAVAHQIDEDRWDAIGDVRQFHVDFEERSLERAILSVVHSVEKGEGYVEALGELIRGLFQHTEIFVIKVTLMLASDYVRLPMRDQAVMRETIAYCEGQLEVGSDYRHVTLSVIGVFFLQKVFDVQ